MSSNLVNRLSPGEQAIVAQVVARGWATSKQVDQTIESILARRVEGPINEALLAQRLITRPQSEQLEDYLHKDMVVGEFVVDRKLGAGAMGDVFLAHRETDGTKVALKLINKRYADDDQFVKRFEREIQALRGLEHESIAAAVGYGTHEDLPYLAMEFVPGPSLAQLLDQHGPLPEGYVLRIGQQVAGGLDHIYERTKLVHRDIKPENILTVPAEDAAGDDLFSRLDSAKLIDFGLARSYSSDERLTMTGITMGTPHYMSPEQIRGSQNVDLRSDIYGLGATMFHLLTGQTPFEGSSPGAVMTAHLTDPVPDPKATVPGISAGTRDLVMMCMAKDPGDRYHSYAGFTKACDEVLAMIGESAASGIRLLRKPLVVNKPGGKRKGTEKTARVDPDKDKERKVAVPVPGREPEEDEASNGNKAKKPGSGTNRHPLSEAAPDSDRIQRPGTSRTRRSEQASSDEYEIPDSEHILRREQSTNRIEREAAEQHGIAVLPLMVLGAAVVALVAILVWRAL